MHEDAFPRTPETQLGAQVLSLLDFALKADVMLGHCIGIDLDEGVVTLSPELTAVEFLSAILVALMRIMTGHTVTDRNPFYDITDSLTTLLAGGLMATA